MSSRNAGSQYGSQWHSSVTDILQKLMSVDPDIRYMALSDLIVGLRQLGMTINDSTAPSLAAQVVRSLLTDINGEVQNLAVQALPLLVERFDNVMESVATTLIESLSSTDGAVRDISATALKAIIKQVSVERSVKQVSNALIPGLFRLLSKYIQDLQASTREQQKALPVPQDVFDSLLECIQHYTENGVPLENYMSLAKSDIVSLSLQLLRSEITGMRKRAGTLLAVVSPQLSQGQFNTVISALLDYFNSRDSVVDVRNLESGAILVEVTKSFISLFKALVSKCPCRMGPTIPVMVAQLLSLLCNGYTVSNSRIEEGAIFVSESFNVEFVSKADCDIDNVNDELRELILNAFIAVLENGEVESSTASMKTSGNRKRNDVTITEAIENYLSSIKLAAVRLLRYDPNYTYENDNEGSGSEANDGMEVDSNADQLGDDNGDDEVGSDDDDSTPFDDFDDDYTGLDFSDDDDTAWKVRRASARLLYAFVLHPTCRFGPVVLGELLPYLISRTVEREESVRVEIFALLILIVKLCKIKDTISTCTSSNGYPSDADNTMLDAQGMEVSSPSSSKRARRSVEALGGEDDKDGKTCSTKISSTTELSRSVPKLYKVAFQFLTSNTYIDRIAVISLLREIVCTVEDGLQDSLGSLIPVIFDGLSATKGIRGISGSTNPLKTELITFLGAIIRYRTPAQLHHYYPQIVNALVSVVDARTYRLSGLALDILRLLVERTSSLEDRTLRLSISQVETFTRSALAVLSGNEDNSVKEKALVLVGRVITTSGDVTPNSSFHKLQDQVFKELLKRYSNEVLSVTAACTFISIFRSQGRHSIGVYIPEILRKSIDYLKKNIKELRHRVLQLVEVIFTLADDILPILVAESISVGTDDGKQSGLLRWTRPLLDGVFAIAKVEDVDLTVVLDAARAILSRCLTEMENMRDIQPQLASECFIALDYIFNVGEDTTSALPRSSSLDLERVLEDSVVSLFLRDVVVHGAANKLGTSLDLDCLAISDAIQRFATLLVKIKPEFVAIATSSLDVTKFATLTRDQQPIYQRKSDSQELMTDMISRNASITFRNSLTFVSAAILTAGLSLSQKYCKIQLEKGICTAQQIAIEKLTHVVKAIQEMCEKDVLSYDSDPNSQLTRQDMSNSQQTQTADVAPLSLLLDLVHSVLIQSDGVDPIRVLDPLFSHLAKDLLVVCTNYNKYSVSTLDSATAVLGVLSIRLSVCDIIEAICSMVASALTESLETGRATCGIHALASALDFRLLIVVKTMNMPSILARRSYAIAIDTIKDDTIETNPQSSKTNDDDYEGGWCTELPEAVQGRLLRFDSVMTSVLTDNSLGRQDVTGSTMNYSSTESAVSKLWNAIWRSLTSGETRRELFVARTASLNEAVDDGTVEAASHKFTFAESIRGRRLRHSLARLAGFLATAYPQVFCGGPETFDTTTNTIGITQLARSSNASSGNRARAVAAEAIRYLASRTRGGNGGADNDIDDGAVSVGVVSNSTYGLLTNRTIANSNRAIVGDSIVTSMLENERFMSPLWLSLVDLAADTDLTVQREALRTILVLLRSEHPVLAQSMGYLARNAMQVSAINGSDAEGKNLDDMTVASTKLLDPSSVLQRCFPSDKIRSTIKDEFYLGAIIAVLEQFVFVPRPELITVVHTGPFKRDIDHGLELRKLACELLYAIVSQQNLVFILVQDHANISNSSSTVNVGFSALKRLTTLVRLGCDDTNADISRIAQLARRRLRSTLLSSSSSELFARFLLISNPTASAATLTSDDRSSSKVLTTSKASRVAEERMIAFATMESARLRSGISISQVLYARLRGVSSILPGAVVSTSGVGSGTTATSTRNRESPGDNSNITGGNGANVGLGNIGIDVDQQWDVLGFSNDISIFTSTNHWRRWDIDYMRQGNSIGGNDVNGTSTNGNSNNNVTMVARRGLRAANIALDIATRMIKSELVVAEQDDSSI